MQQPRLPAKRPRESSPRDSDFPQYPIILIVPERVCKPFLDQQLLLDVREKSEVERIHFAPNVNVQGISGGLFYLYDSIIEHKLNALHFILLEMHSNLEGQGLTEIEIWIPEYMVSQIIGKHGQQVKNLTKICETNISLKDKASEFKERIVKIKGKIPKIERAVKYIYRIVLNRVPMLTEKPPESVIKAKIVVDNSVIQILTEAETSFINRLQNEIGCDVLILPSKGPPIGQTQSVLVVTGKVDIWMEAVEKLLTRIDTANHQSNIQHNQFFILVRSNAVNRLIGTGGTSIKEIITKSKGAGIKVLSNRQSEREYEHSMVEINGQVAARIRAIKEIINRVEITKQKTTESPEELQPRHAETTTYLLIDSAHVPKLIGKNHENLTAMVQRTGAKISFANQDHKGRLMQALGMDRGTVCNIKGVHAAVINAVRLITKKIIELESN